jgi:Tfp pilus assembly protein PilF
LKKTVLLFVCFVTLSALAQDAVTLYETGRIFLNQGDYDNAILVLKRACAAAPNTMTYEKDLTNAYYFKGDYDNAKNSIEKLIEREDNDAATFLLAGNISIAQKDMKAAEKYYKRGLKKFENSGMLYDAYGQILWAQKDYSAIKQWEKGIATDPNFPGNYYNAAIYYYLTKDANEKIWCLYYGENFVNLESYSTRTIEIKSILLDAYKKLFQDEQFLKTKTKNNFENAFKQTAEKLYNTVSTGVNTENLMMLRSLFILDWFYIADKPKSSLYEKHQQLLKEGLFEAYNYWLFEGVVNLAVYENWTTLHKTENDQFVKYSQNRVFKIGSGQYFK